MTENKPVSNESLEQARQFASLIITQKRVLSAVKGENRTLTAHSPVDIYRKPIVNEKKVANVVFNSMQDINNPVTTANEIEPENLNGIEQELYKQTKLRLNTEVSRIAHKKKENSLRLEEIVDIVQQPAREAVNPINVLKKEKRNQIHANLKKAGYSNENAKKAVKDMLVSGVVSTSAFALSELAKVGTIAWTLNNLPALDNINEPGTLAAIAASYISVAGIAAIMPNIQEYMIRTIGWSSDALSVGLTKFLAPLISTVNENGEFVLDKNKHLNLVRGSIWLPQIAKGAYHGAIGGALSPLATITANFTSSAFKCVEMAVLYGLARKSEGLPILPIEKTKEKVTNIYNKAKVIFKRNK